jgi:hypothetical protein
MFTFITISIVPEEGTILPLENIIRDRLRTSPIFEAYALISISRKNDNICYAHMMRDKFAIINPEFATILNDKTNYIPHRVFITNIRNPIVKAPLLVGIFKLIIEIQQHQLILLHQ